MTTDLNPSLLHFDPYPVKHLYLHGNDESAYLPRFSGLPRLACPVRLNLNFGIDLMGGLWN